VIYLGTFSKVFFPALRLGYIVAPPTLIDTFTIAQRVMSFHPPGLEQVAMASSMVDQSMRLFFVKHTPGKQL
jgi:GntR family transcriptional regulator / MocR family aminotransferase